MKQYGINRGQSSGCPSYYCQYRPFTARRALLLDRSSVIRYLQKLCSINRVRSLLFSVLRRGEQENNGTFPCFSTLVCLSSSSSVNDRLTSGAGTGWSRRVCVSGTVPVCARARVWLAGYGCIFRERRPSPCTFVLHVP